MHDTVNIEATGIPMVFVATTEFVTGAEVQAKALGADPAAVFIAHPIQDRTDEEVQALADGAVDELVGKLVSE